jgi:hypothetical protein
LARGQRLIGEDHTCQDKEKRYNPIFNGRLTVEEGKPTRQALWGLCFFLQLFCFKL